MNTSQQLFGLIALLIIIQAVLVTFPWLIVLIALYLLCDVDQDNKNVTARAARLLGLLKAIYGRVHQILCSNNNK